MLDAQRELAKAGAFAGKLHTSVSPWTML